MFIYAIRRLLIAIPVLIAASMFSFLLVDLSSDPVADYKLQLASQSTNGEIPKGAVHEFAAHLYLDRSVPERYWLWLTGIGGRGDIGLLRGKFGPSILGDNNPIGAEISDRFMITFRLVLIATLAAIVIAIVTGVISAVKQYRRVDYALTFVGFLALAMPTFWIAALIKETGIWANQQAGTTIFYTIGATSPDTSDYSAMGKAGDIVGHLILPTLALMLHGYAAASRYQRAAMLEVLDSDYVRLARAKGVRNRTVMRRHALRTSLTPIATFAPLSIAAALSGAIIVERIFNWEGMGLYVLESIQKGDSFAVMAFLLVSGMLVIAANLVSDLLYGWLDPRIRYE
ncbi:ABC transporter permease [Stackebrandtia sp.]|uniref:ABC transporter permease n=1 Tax=Stackebrandtia sp. TaxID=2023065 RepID=UPI0032C23280